MKPRQPSPSTALAPLVYWLLLVSGLAVLTVVRFGEVEKMLPLWLGAVLGTGFGQILARRRMRLWLVGIIILNAMWFGALLMMPLWAILREVADPWVGVEVSVLAFAPAALCGYFSLTEQGGLLAFWFPAVFWVLSILDRPGSAALADQGGWLLLSGLAVLFLGFLHARETRRIALWRTTATVRIAPPRSRAVLREAPLRVLGQVAWLAGVGAATLVLTAWIAPHLWQKDKLVGAAVVPPRPASPATVAAAGTGGTGAAAEPKACCPEPEAVVTQRERVREYFPLLHTHDEAAPAPAPRDCVACSNGVPVATTETRVDPHTEAPTVPSVTPGTRPATATVATGGGVPPRYQDSTVSSPSAVAVATAAPPPPPAYWPKPSTPPAAPTTTSTPPPPPPRPQPIALTPVPRTAATVAGPRAPRVVLVAVAPEDGHPFEWLVTLSLVGLALHLALRPLRRLMVLRHLGHPVWPETVDQRVSNLWELMLIGLRDAGWRTVPGEQPLDLARRIGLDGMKTCAGVLERARHGVRVDAADLEAMSGAAEAVYRGARSRIGWAARAASWLRWPLV